MLALGDDVYTGGAFAGFNPTTSNTLTTGIIFQNFYGGPAIINNDYTATFSFVGPSATAALVFVLDVSGQYQYDDFGDTAIFSFDTLPSGVSYASASGDFLTAVPEPSTWVTLSIGFACLGIAGYRRSSPHSTSYFSFEL